MKIGGAERKGGSILMDGPDSHTPWRAVSFPTVDSTTLPHKICDTNHSDSLVTLSIQTCIRTLCFQNFFNHPLKPYTGTLPTGYVISTGLLLCLSRPRCLVLTASAVWHVVLKASFSFLFQFLNFVTDFHIWKQGSKDRILRIIF